MVGGERFELSTSAVWGRHYPTITNHANLRGSGKFLAKFYWTFTWLNTSIRFMRVNLWTRLYCGCSLSVYLVERAWPFKAYLSLLSLYLPYLSAWALKKSVHSQFLIVQFDWDNGKCRVGLPTFRDWQAELTCLFTPQNSTVNSYIHVWGAVTYHVILVSYWLNSRVNSLLHGLDDPKMTISVGKHLTFPMWTSGRALFLHACIR